MAGGARSRGPTLEDVARIERQYEDELVWRAMREAGLSVEDVKVRDIYARIDDERPDPQEGVFRVTFEWRAPHEVCLRILQRARDLEAETPLAQAHQAWNEDHEFD